MFDGIYGYFFGGNEASQSIGDSNTDTVKDDWTLVDRNLVCIKFDKYQLL